MNGQSFDINKLPATDGYLIFPLSMSRLQGGQSPEECYSVIERFEGKINQIGIDGVFLYTNGLYFNADESALSIRKRTNNQMLQHRNALTTLVEKQKKYIPQAMHFFSFYYAILNSPRFSEFYDILKKQSETDEAFMDFLRTGLGEREATDANLSFLIEEIVVTHLIRQEMVELPKTLVKGNAFRLVIYPGPYFMADLYQWKNTILPKNTDCKNPYQASHYDSKNQLLYNFDKIEL